MPKARSRAVQLTFEEIVATLRRTNIPTVVIEGLDDSVVYRRLEAESRDIQLSSFPVGGRSRVLELFENRDNLGLPANISFAADKDNWVFEGVPAKFTDPRLTFTRGYSIENDLYSDGELESLLVDDERRAFIDELSRFLRWYVEVLLDADQDALGKHPNVVLGSSFTPRAWGDAEQKMYERMEMTYASELRGKSLMGLLVRQLSRPARHVSHRIDALLEVAAAKKGACISELFASVRQYHT